MTVAEATPPSPSRALSRGTRTLLVASLALNLLLIGFAASAMWRHRQGHTIGGNPINADLMGFTETLPDERHKALMRQTAEERRQLRPFRTEVRQARLSAREAFLAEPFNPAEFAKAQDRLLDAEMRARKEAHRLFLAVANALTPEERASFVRWRPEERDHARGRKRWWKRETNERDAIPPAIAPAGQTSNPK